MSISCIEHNYPLLERITDFCRGTEVRKFKWVSGELTKALRGNHFQWKSMKCTSDTHPSLFNFSIVGPDLLPAFSLTMFVSQVQFSILYSKVSSSGNLHKHYSLSKHRCQCIGNNWNYVSKLKKRTWELHHTGIYSAYEPRIEMKKMQNGFELNHTKLN